MTDQADIANWFLTRADPEHVSITLNGVKWDYQDGKWGFVLINPDWRAHWNQLNDVAIKLNNERWEL